MTMVPAPRRDDDDDGNDDAMAIAPAPAPAATETVAATKTMSLNRRHDADDASNVGDKLPHGWMAGWLDGWMGIMFLPPANFGRGERGPGVERGGGDPGVAVLTAVSAYTGLHFCLGIYNLRSLFASSDSALFDDLRTFINHKSTGSVIGLESPKQSN